MIYAAHFEQEVQMVVAAPPEDGDLVVTVSPVVMAAVGATFLVWITLLTVFVVVRCREPWRDDGRPVFKRMPDGRIRFSWGVATQLASVRAEAEARETDTCPTGTRMTAFADRRWSRSGTQSGRTS